MELVEYSVATINTENGESNMPKEPTSTTIVFKNEMKFGPESQRVTCPKCKKSIMTETEAKVTMKTHALALLMCCFLCIPCMFLPYVTKSCKDITHTCPNCKYFLGTYKNW